MRNAAPEDMSAAMKPMFFPTARNRCEAMRLERRQRINPMIAPAPNPRSDMKRRGFISFTSLVKDQKPGLELTFARQILRA